MKTKTEKISHRLFDKLLVGILIGSFLVISGCQVIQDSAKELRGAIDQTVSNAETKINSLRDSFTQTASDVQKTVEDTKNTVQAKVDQVKEAGDKIEKAQQAVQEANQAVSNITK